MSRDERAQEREAIEAAVRGDRDPLARLLEGFRPRLERFVALPAAPGPAVPHRPRRRPAGSPDRGWSTARASCSIRGRAISTPGLGSSPGSALIQEQRRHMGAECRTARREHAGLPDVSSGRHGERVPRSRLDAFPACRAERAGGSPDRRTGGARARRSRGARAASLRGTGQRRGGPGSWSSPIRRRACATRARWRDCAACCGASGSSRWRRRMASGTARGVLGFRHRAWNRRARRGVLGLPGARGNGPAWRALRGEDSGGPRRAARRPPGAGRPEGMHSCAPPPKAGQPARRGCVPGSELGWLPDRARARKRRDGRPCTRARDLRLGRRVALKLLPPRAGPGPALPRALPARGRAPRARLRHANIIQGSWRRAGGRPRFLRDAVRGRGVARSDRAPRSGGVEGGLSGARVREPRAHRRAHRRRARARARQRRAAPGREAGQRAAGSARARVGGRLRAVQGRGRRGA